MFFNLGQLSSAVNRQVEDCKTNAEKSIQEAVDVRLLTDNSSSQGTRPGRANMSISSQVPIRTIRCIIYITCIYLKVNLKANLWASLDEMVEYLHVMIINVQQIQKVILKKRDPVTHLLFSELMANEGCQTNLSLAFWRNLVSHVQKALKKSAQYNVVIKTTFEQGSVVALLDKFHCFFIQNIRDFCEFSYHSGTKFTKTKKASVLCSGQWKQIIIQSRI